MPIRRIRRAPLTVTAVLVAFAAFTACAQSALAATLSPAGDGYKATATAVTFSVGAAGYNPYATCTLTVTGTVPNSGTTIKGSATFSSCEAAGEFKPGTVEVVATQPVQFSFKTGPPLQAAFSLPTSYGLELALDNPLMGRCYLAQYNSYTNTSTRDTWQNGSNSPLVNSHSVLDERAIKATKHGDCLEWPYSELVNVYMSTAPSHPLIWTDTTNPAKTILFN